ncbi:putative F-box-containing protein [Namao virus]|nr:putative F-box-containing protein [Namao virus]
MIFLLITPAFTGLHIDMWDKLPFDLFIGVSAHLSIADLAACRLACARWRAMADDDLVWSRRQPRPAISPDCWKGYSVLVAKERNLVANPNAHSDMARWVAKNTYYSHWCTVPTSNKEKESMVQRPDKNIVFYFLCMFGRSDLFQTVDLVHKGYSRNLLDVVRPHLAVSFWYAVERDMAARYTYCLELISDDMRVLDRVGVVVKFKKIQNYEWHRAEHVFRDYAPGARYVHIWHSAKCNANMSGIGITGHTLLVKYPVSESPAQGISEALCVALCAPCRCAACDRFDCDSAACLRFKCGLAPCKRVSPGAGSCVTHCYHVGATCVCQEYDIAGCDCANCGSMRRYFVKRDTLCKCQKCNDCCKCHICMSRHMPKTTCGCVSCRCSDCGSDECPCRICTCDVSNRFQIIQHYDIKSYYFKLHC